jgi:hypothetical protein
MKITEVQTEIFSAPLIPQILVRVRTDEGLEGVGEAWWGLPAGPGLGTPTETKK